MYNRVEKEIEGTFVSSSTGFLTADSRSTHNDDEFEDGEYFNVMAELRNEHHERRKIKIINFI